MNITTGGKGASITINGKNYSGKNVQIIGNDIIIDGETQGEVQEKVVNVTVHGDVDNINNGSGDVTVGGNSGPIKTGSGDVSVGQHALSINTGSGDVEVEGSCNGSINTGSGDVKVKGSVSGSVSSMTGKIVHG